MKEVLDVLPQPHVHLLLFLIGRIKAQVEARVQYPQAEVQELCIVRRNEELRVVVVETARTLPEVEQGRRKLDLRALHRQSSGHRDLERFVDTRDVVAAPVP